MYKTLVIEDNSQFRETLIGLLNDRFRLMRVESAADGKSALDKFMAFFPNLILMDIRLPGENGLELTKKIRLQDSNVTIVVLTSNDAPEYRQAANRNGANFFISKTNTSADEIVHLVESIVSKKRNDQMSI